MKPGGPARRVINIIRGEPKLVAPDIKQQDNHGAENVKADFFNMNRFVPTVRERVTIEVDSQNGVLVREGEEAQPKEHVQQNAAGRNDEGGNPKRLVLEPAFAPTHQPKGEHHDRHDKQ